MSLKIKSLAKGQPGVPGGGEIKYYASAVMDGEMDIDALTKAIETITNERALLLSEIREAVDNVNLVKKGRLQARPAKDLLNEI